MSRSLLRRPRSLVLLFGLLAVAGLARAWHLDDRARLWLKENAVSESERAASIWLPGYQAVIEAKALAGLDADETSDLTYNPSSRTLFTVTGRSPQLVELSLAGEVLRRIPLIGFANPEGVAVLADGTMAITDERRHTLSIFRLGPLTVELDARDSEEFDLGVASVKNKGFEGIAWDPAQQRLLLGQERSPLALYSWASDGRGELDGGMQPLRSDQLYMRNLSALSVDPRTGHTLVLSAQSNLLLEIDERGEPVSFISLIGGFNGLERKIPRAEGVAIDEQGTIYLVSEPNLFYVFRKDEAPGGGS